MKYSSSILHPFRSCSIFDKSAFYSVHLKVLFSVLSRQDIGHKHVIFESRLNKSSKGLLKTVTFVVKFEDDSIRSDSQIVPDL